MSTNLILLGARDKKELDQKKGAIWGQFVKNRQEKLEKYGAAHPENPFYAPKTEENGQLHRVYTAEVGPAHEQFFEDNQKAYKAFAQGLQKLDSLLVLPYTAGEAVTASDLHVVPWLAHALWGAGGTSIDDFAPLERLINKSDPGFKFGEKTKTWWKNISATPAFQQVFAELH